MASINSSLGKSIVHSVVIGHFLVPWRTSFKQQDNQNLGHLQGRTRLRKVDPEKACMGRTTRIARVSARGGFNLFWGLVVSNVISAISTIVVARMLSPAEYGLVGVASAAPGLIALFRDWGMDTAMVRHIAQLRSEDDPTGVRNTILAGLTFMLLGGLLLSVISFFLSGILAAEVFHRPEMTSLIRVSSFVIFAGALLLALESVFAGFEEMSYRSLVLVSQASLKVILSPLLIVFGLGALGAVLGATLSTLLAGSVGISLLYFFLYRKLRKRVESHLELTVTIKTMLRYGLPLFISGIVGGFLAQFNNFLTAIYCTDQAIGNYSVAMNFTTLISFFSLPIASVLFPAFSKLDSEKDKEALATVFRLSVKYGTLLVVPAATAIMILSPLAVATLFGTKYGDAPLYLTLLSFGALYTALGNLSIGSFINSRGRTGLSMRLALVYSAMGFPLGLVLISRFQILGLITANLITGIPSLLLGLWLIKRYWGATIDYYASAKTLAASALAALVTYIAVRTVVLPDWLLLFMGALLFLAIYVLTVPLVGALDREDIKTMQEMIKELGPLSRFLHKPIDLMNRLTRSKG